MSRWYTGKSCRLSVMLALTFSYFLVEVVIGYMTNSMALVADSFHMLSDVLALLVAMFCMKISSKKGSHKNTFGWVRAEVLGALVNAVFLLALCFSIFIESIKRLLEPEKINSPVLILIVGSLGLLVNVIGIFMFHGHASVHGHSHARPVPLDLENDDLTPEQKRNIQKTVQKVSNEAHSISILNGPVDYSEQENLVTPTSIDQGGQVTFPNHKHITIDNEDIDQKHDKPVRTASAAQLNMHGVFLHILGDAFGSIVVIVNALVVWKVDNDNLAKYLDPSLSLVMVLIISSTTIPLLKESAFILLQTVPTHINAIEIKRKLLKMEGVLAVHEFHVWKLAGNKIIGTAHIRCRNMHEYMGLANQIKELFHDQGIHSTTIQPEFADSMEEASDESISMEDDCFVPCPTKSALPCTTTDQCCSTKLIVEKDKKKKDATGTIPLLPTPQGDPRLPEVQGVIHGPVTSHQNPKNQAPVVETRVDKL